MSWGCIYYFKHPIKPVPVTAETTKQLTNNCQKKWSFLTNKITLFLVYDTDIGGTGGGVKLSD